MARPSKYTSETLKRIERYLSDGLTVRDCCYGVGITEDTFCRWRREKPEFAKLVQKATEAQNWSSEALARTSEYRRYRRKAKRYQMREEHEKWSDTHIESENALETPLNASERQLEWLDKLSFTARKVDAVAMLPIHNEPATNAFGELMRTAPYYNPATDRVEWVEKETFGYYVLHRCSPDKWRELSEKSGAE